jgi:tetrahydromethanopterin S-methyltransferase subunit C
MVAQLAATLTQLVDSAAVLLPGLVAAIILLVIGLVIGKIVGRVVKEVLVRVRLDYYVYEKAKAPISLSDLFSVVARWWIYLAFVTAATSTNILGIPAAAAWMASVNAYVPAIIAASVILGVAYVLSEYVKMHFLRQGTPNAAMTGKLIWFFVMYGALALVLPVLGLQSVSREILLVAIGAVGLAFALSVGMSGDMMKMGKARR